ncbi:hypothetical protein TomTYG45_37980 [Sphingobium sp. TomTYG45]|jgi:hypothetical protein
MTDTQALAQRAIKLMNEAIILLDAAGEDIAAARLQAAIDTIRHPPTSPTDPMPET